MGASGGEAAVWQEARRLAELLEEITRRLAEKAAGGQVEELPALLGRRQQICERLDRLRSEWGIPSWTEGVQAPPAAADASREIGEIFRRVAGEDDRIRRILEERRAAVREELDRVRRLRRAQRAYAAEGPLPFGAFIDNRR